VLCEILYHSYQLLFYRANVRKKGETSKYFPDILHWRRVCMLEVPVKRKKSWLQ